MSKAWRQKTSIVYGFDDYLHVTFKDHLIKIQFLSQTNCTMRCQHFHRLYRSRQWNSLWKGSHNKTFVVTNNSSQTCQAFGREGCAIKIDLKPTRRGRRPFGWTDCGRYSMGWRGSLLKFLEIVYCHWADFSTGTATSPTRIWFWRDQISDVVIANNSKRLLFS